jgi:predicted nucleotidyltransferase
MGGARRSPASDLRQRRQWYDLTRMAAFGVPHAAGDALAARSATLGSADEPIEAVTADAIAVLRQAVARFAYLHGSRATGQHRAGSDIDIAAYFGGQPDELPRITRSHREFAAAVAGRNR